MLKIVFLCNTCFLLAGEYSEFLSVNKYPFIFCVLVFNSILIIDMCGVFGIVGHPQSRLFLPTVLASLQHRGHDAAGVAGFVMENTSCLETVKDIGKVETVINQKSLKKFFKFADNLCKAGKNYHLGRYVWVLLMHLLLVLDTNVTL